MGVAAPSRRRFFEPGPPSFDATDEARDADRGGRPAPGGADVLPVAVAMAAEAAPAAAPATPDAPVANGVGGLCVNEPIPGPAPVDRDDKD